MWVYLQSQIIAKLWLVQRSNFAKGESYKNYYITFVIHVREAVPVNECFAKYQYLKFRNS